MASSSLTPVMKEDVVEFKTWAELPSDLTSSILRRLCAVDILDNAQKVCTTWRRICKDRAMWRKIDMGSSLGHLACDMKYVTMCRHAVDRSQGGLVEIDIWFIGTDSLLNYIADSSSNLKSLRLGECDLLTNEGFTEALVKLPLLEELEVSYCSLSIESLKVVGQSCPKLKTLKLNRRCYRRPRYVCEEDALAIAETMPGLVDLQLFGNMLSDIGLNAILDNCPNLEHLDLRHCLNVNFAGDLEKRCSERIKVLRRPNDSTHDYPYAGYYYEIDSSEDYYPEVDYPEDDDYYPYGLTPYDNYDHDAAVYHDHSSNYDPRYNSDDSEHLYDIFGYMQL
ncbi:F-box protein SKIP19 [Raphanus sativus]|nr:F-box protein SKIP19 [Raphanus sativus]